MNIYVLYIVMKDNQYVLLLKYTKNIISKQERKKYTKIA